ncbi:hypothetical protein AAY473_005516 [Plecturocebus cupreus]
MHHHAQLIFVFLVEMGFHHVGQVGLELLASSDLPASASQSAEITVYFELIYIYKNCKNSTFFTANVNILHNHTNCTVYGKQEINIDAILLLFWRQDRTL